MPTYRFETLDSLGLVTGMTDGEEFVDDAAATSAALLHKIDSDSDLVVIFREIGEV